MTKVSLQNDSKKNKVVDFKLEHGMFFFSPQTGKLYMFVKTENVDNDLFLYDLVEVQTGLGLFGNGLECTDRDELLSAFGSEILVWEKAIKEKLEDYELIVVEKVKISYEL